MLTFNALVTELQCNPDDLERIIQHGLIQPISEIEGTPVYAPSVLDLLEQDFQGYLEICDKMDKETDEQAKKDTRGIYRDEKELERNIEDDSFEEKELETDEPAKSSDEPVSEDILIDSDEEEPKKKSKKKKKKRESGFLDGEYKRENVRIFEEQGEKRGLDNSPSYVPEQIGADKDNFIVNKKQQNNVIHIGNAYPQEYGNHESEKAPVQKDTNRNTISTETKQNAIFIGDSDTQSKSEIYKPNFHSGEDNFRQQSVSSQNIQDNTIHIGFSAEQREDKSHVFKNPSLQTNQPDYQGTNITIKGQDNHNFFQSRDSQKNPYVENNIPFHENGQGFYKNADDNNDLKEKIVNSRMSQPNTFSSKEKEYIDTWNEEHKRNDSKDIFRIGKTTSVSVDSSDDLFSETRVSGDSHVIPVFTEEKQNQYVHTNAHDFGGPAFIVSPKYVDPTTQQIYPEYSLSNKGTTKIGDGTSFVKDFMSEQGKNKSSDVKITQARKDSGIEYLKNILENSENIVCKIQTGEKNIQSASYSQVSENMNLEKIFSSYIKDGQDKKTAQLPIVQKSAGSFYPIVFASPEEKKAWRKDETQTFTHSLPYFTIHSSVKNQSGFLNSSSSTFAEARENNIKMNYSVQTGKKLSETHFKKVKKIDEKLRMLTTREFYSTRLRQLQQKSSILIKNVKHQEKNKQEEKLLLAKGKTSTNKIPKLRFTISHTSGTMFCDYIGMNNSEFMKNTHKVENILSPATMAFKSLGSIAAADLALKTMNKNWDITKSFTFFKEKNLRMSDSFLNGTTFGKQNIEEFMKLSNSFFMKKYNVNLAKMEKNALLDFRGTLKGRDIELFDMRMDGSNVMKHSIHGKYSATLLTLAFQSALKTVEGSDAYNGGMLIYRSGSTVLLSVKVGRKVLNKPAQKMAQATLRAMEKNEFTKKIKDKTKDMTTDLNKKTADFAKKTVKKTVTLVSDLAVVKSARNVVRIGKEKAIINASNVVNKIRYSRFGQSRLGRGLGKAGGAVFNAGATVVHAGAVVVKSGAIATQYAAKAVGTLFKTIDWAKMLTLIAVGLLLLIWFLLMCCSSLITGFLHVAIHDAPTIVKKGIEYVTGENVDKVPLSYADTSDAKNSAYAYHLLESLYDQNMKWYESQSEEAKKTPQQVAKEYGGNCVGGTDPKTNTPHTITKWGDGTGDGIYYEFYNGNSIQLDADGIPQFVENSTQSVFDASARPKSVFSMAYVQYKMMLNQNNKETIGSSENKAKKAATVSVETYAQDIMQKSQVRNDKISDVYQCGKGCSILKNYYCVDELNKKRFGHTLAGMKGPTIAGYNTAYKFINADDKGTINNHDGKGCTFYQCFSDKKDWWTTKHTKYGCEKEKEGYTKNVKVYNALDIESAFMDGKWHTSAELNEIAKAETKKNKEKAEEEAKKAAEVSASATPAEPISPEYTNSPVPTEPVEIKYDVVENPLKLLKTKIDPKSKILENGSKVSKTYKSIDGKKRRYIVANGKITAYKFTKKGVYIKVVYDRYACKGHYDCPGNHSKHYCMGHVDLTVRSAIAGLGQDEENRNQIYNLSSYGEEKSIHVNGIDGKGKSCWEGWNSGNLEWLYGIYNQNWEEKGLDKYSGIIEAGFANGVSSSVDTGDYILTDTYGSEDGAKAATWAVKQNGKRYSQAVRFGPDAFDCSGLCYKAWQYAGYDISENGNSTAAGIGHKTSTDKKGLKLYDASDPDMSSNTAKDTALNSLQPGDLIFYSRKINGRFLNITHVAMFCAGVEGAGTNDLIEAKGVKYGVVLTPSRQHSYNDIVLITRPLLVATRSQGKSMAVPNPPKNVITHMAYQAITSKTSYQYKLQRYKNTYTDGNTGIRYVICTDGADKDVKGGVKRYCIAMGSFYTKSVGDKFDITFANGETVPFIIGDQKADQHTNPTHQYHAKDYSVVEMIIDSAYKQKYTKLHASAKNKFPGNQKIIRIVYQGHLSGFDKSANQLSTPNGVKK